MWYLVWLVGLPLAAAFAIASALWYELKDEITLKNQNKSSSSH